MLVLVHVGQRTAAVGALLIERNEPVLRGARDNDLEFAGRVDDLDGRTGAVEFRSPVETDRDQTRFDANAIGRRLRHGAAVFGSLGETGAWRAGEARGGLQPAAAGDGFHSNSEYQINESDYGSRYRVSISFNSFSTAWRASGDSCL